MDTFTVRDLREHTGDFIHDAEAGNLSLVTKHGRPVILAVPFDESLLEFGLRFTIAAKLYQEETLTLEKAAKFANQSIESFIEDLAGLGIAVARYSRKDLANELKHFDE